MKILTVFLDPKFSSTIQSSFGTKITETYRVTVTCIWQNSLCQLYSVRLNKEREVKGEKMAGTGANHLGLSFRLYNSGTE